jgi:hypothetical protein
MAKVYRFKPEAFPVLIQALHPITRKVVWFRRVEKPTTASDLKKVTIPPLSKLLGHPVTIQITWADGSVSLQEAPPIVDTIQ